jgi:hypothetical protein
MMLHASYEWGASPVATTPIRSSHTGLIAGFAALHRKFPHRRRSYPVAASIRLRAIHKFANANSVVTCAPFLAIPR